MDIPKNMIISKERQRDRANEYFNHPQIFFLLKKVHVFTVYNRSSQFVKKKKK